MPVAIVETALFSAYDVVDGATAAQQQSAAAASAKKESAPAPKKPVVQEEEEEDDDDDLFREMTPEEEEAHERMLKEKVAAARAGKPEKEKPKARSMMVFDIKPNDIETDLEAMALKIKAEISHPGIQNW